MITSSILTFSIVRFQEDALDWRNWSCTIYIASKGWTKVFHDPMRCSVSGYGVTQLFILHSSKPFRSVTGPLRSPAFILIHFYVISIFRWVVEKHLLTLSLSSWYCWYSFTSWKTTDNIHQWVYMYVYSTFSQVSGLNDERDITSKMLSKKGYMTIPKVKKKHNWKGMIGMITSHQETPISSIIASAMQYREHMKKH